jgi:Mycothiol maleylpyruvate isomerase N-terminal domain
LDPRLDPVIAETNDNRQHFEAFCRALTAAELGQPVPAATWSVKDYIAHLATIDIWVGDWFEHMADGRAWLPKAEDGGPFNIDAWNEAEVVKRRPASVEELLAEGAGHRARLLASWDRFTPETLDGNFDFRGNSISFLRYLQLWAGHDPAHTMDMLRALPAREPDPAVAAWAARAGIASR